MADDVYHVTFTKNIPDIQERGLDPLSQSLWTKQETGERYQQEPSVYGFTNPEDALSWAGKMSWDFRDEAGKHSDYSIIRLKGGEHWEDDPSEDPRLTKERPAYQGLDDKDPGRSVRYQGHIKPEDIVSITQFPEGAGVNEEFKAKFPEGMYDEWIKYYGDQLRGLPQDEPRSTDLIPLAPDLATLALLPEEDPSQKKPKQTGKAWRGIGSLMRKRMFPILQVAQQAWGTLSDDQKGQVTEFLNTPTHELFGMDKPGIDYFRQMLGMGPEQGGIAALQDLREPVPVYQSAVARAVDALPMDKGPGEQMLAMVSKSSGVKPEEIEWTGLAGFLKDKKSVTKQEIQDFISANQLRINEIVRSEGAMTDAFESSFAEGSIDAPDRQPIFEQHTLPGGENYREVVLTLANRSLPLELQGGAFAKTHGYDVDKVLNVNTEEGRHWQRAIKAAGQDNSQRNFTGGHYGSEHPNVLAHIRLNDRTGPNGEKILFVEEIQSDWHQKGRREGYRTPVPPIDEATRKKVVRYRELSSIGNRMASDTPREITDEWRLLKEELEPWLGLRGRGVPDAPLKKTWHEMSLRRVLRMAAEEGYDSVAWTPGEVQADRYNLRKRVSEIHYAGTSLRVYDLDGEKVLENNGVKHEDLPDIIGKEAADRLLAQTPDAGLRSLVGEELEIGGEGMKGFYDNMLKNYAKKFGKKFGAEVGTTEISVYDMGLDWHTIGEDVMEYLGIPSSERAEYERNATLDQLSEVMEQYIKSHGAITEVWNLPITPEMKEELLRQGVSTFAQGGFIDKPLYDRSL